MENFSDKQTYIISSLYFLSLNNEDITNLLAQNNVYFELGHEIDTYNFLRIIKADRFIFNNNCTNLTIKINSFEELNELHHYLNNIQNKVSITLMFTNKFFEPKNFSKISSLNLSIISKVYDFKRVNIYFNGIEFESIVELIQFKKYIDIILSHIPYGANEVDTITYLSSFIINYLTFDNESVKNYREKNIKVPDRDEVKTLEDGMGVCEDYAKFAKYLFNLVGIDCFYIECKNKSRKNEYHAYNIVKIDGIPYCLDLSWIKKGLNLSLSTHFLVSTDIFKQTHPNYDIGNEICSKVYPRSEIKKSLERIKGWKNNYRITRDSLDILLNKNVKNKIEKTIDDIDKKRGL